MSQDAILKTNQFDAIVDAATQGATIGENFQALKDAPHLAMAGAQSQPDASSMPASEWEFTKEVRWAESTGRRPLVLRAHTQADLDVLERQILGY